MKPSSTYSPVLYEYLRRYQDNPRSRVFAPLAEAYRKAGLLDEAVEIAREGLRIHPGFVGGRVALARALFDQKKYPEVIEELAPVARDVPDNLVAQRLLAESSLILGRVTQALDSYKMLLYFMPNDEPLARMVQELETRSYANGALVLQESSGQFQVESAAQALASDPELERTRWMRKVEFLQTLLQRVERYRTEAGPAG